MAPSMPRLLALLDSEDIDSIVVCGCAPLRQKQVELAGQACWDRFECDGEDRSTPSSPDKAEQQDGDSKWAEKDQERKGASGQKKKKDSKSSEALKMPECLKGEDLYALLELQTGASQDDCKKAWRKVCLTAHPDKHGDKSPEELEAVNLNFVKLQEAFNILSDVKKRRKYDSMGEFDDRTPSKLKDGQDFYEVFGEVFRRNAKWSDRKPVPDLGNESTPYEKVKTFYDFWFDFESWRDLDEMIMEECGEDCFQDLEEAECREEKRWMERENAKLRSKYQKVERQRIFALTETAERIDPRVRAEKDRQFAAKEAAKAAKEAQRLEAERESREKAERKAAEEEKLREAQKVEKARLEKEKQVKKTARAKLRKLVNNLNLGIFEDQLQEFLLTLDISETSALSGSLENGGTGEAVFASMKSKGFDAIIVAKEKEDENEKSTEAGSGGPSEEETALDPEEAKRIAKEQEAKNREREKRKKKEDEAAAKVRAEEEAKRAAEKEVRDQKKKAEQEKRDREQQKANKKEVERLKREEEKKKKDEEKAAEQARLEKEMNKKQSEEQRKKQQAANQAEEDAKMLEARTIELERDRLARADAFEKLDWTAVVEAAKAALEDPIVAAALAAAQENSDGEDLLDAQLSCMGSFFVLGVRPDGNTPVLGSNLRNRVKKLRTRIRTAASSGELPVTAATDALADSTALEQFMAAARGEGPPPNAKVEAAPEAVPEEASPQKSKKKTKAKAAPADEDLDALLKEFDMTPTESKSKKSGKKK